MLGLSRIVLSQSDDARISILRSTNAQNLYDQTKWILAGLSETGSEGGSDSDSSEDEADKTKVESAVGDVKTYTQCLVDLSAALECPATDPDYEDNKPILPNLEKRSAYDYYSDLILAKYPKASLQVVECLGRANWDRYQRMQLERSQNAKLTPKPQVAGSEFQDSGIGTSLPATYAETIISFMSTLSSGKAIQVPPLPQEARAGELFECGACGNYIRAINNRAWR
jgi:hypothetical protein